MLKEGYEVRNGLVVPVEKKEPRKIAQLVGVEKFLFARGDDGSVWEFLTFGGGQWHRLPDLPNG